MSSSCTEDKVNLVPPINFPDKIDTFNKRKLHNVVVELPGEPPLFLNSLLLSFSPVLMEALDDRSNDLCEPGMVDGRPCVTFKAKSEDARVKMFYKTVIKWMRFGYGEQQEFSKEDCVAALVALIQLELELPEQEEKLKSFIREVSRRDANDGARIVSELLFFADFFNARPQDPKSIETCTFANDCFMLLPKDSLKYVTFGSPHSSSSKFASYLRYVKYYDNMTLEDKAKLMMECDVDTLNEEELELLLPFISKEDIFMIMKLRERKPSVEIPAQRPSEAEALRLELEKKRRELSSMKALCLLLPFIDEA